MTKLIIKLFVPIQSFLLIFQPVSQVQFHSRFANLLHYYYYYSFGREATSQHLSEMVLTAPAVAWLLSLSNPGSLTQTYTLPRHPNPN